MDIVYRNLRVLSSAAESLKCAEVVTKHCRHAVIADLNQQCDCLGNRQRMASADTLLGHEAVYAKRLYGALASEFGTAFSRTPRSKTDYVNELIDSHNYYAYSTALWALGIPYAFAVLHGETRRGALVFDVADMLKDGLLLPLAFSSAKDGLEKTEHKKVCAKHHQLSAALPRLFDEIKVACSL